MKKYLLSLMAVLSICAMNIGLASAEVYTNMSTELEGHVTEATGVVSVLVFAGLGIFALIWGIRIFKRAVKAGA